MFNLKHQLTKQEAIHMGNTTDWSTWTDEQICDFQLYQEYLAVPFDRFQSALTNICGRNVFGYAFLATNYDQLIAEYEQKKAERQSFTEKNLPIDKK